MPVSIKFIGNTKDFAKEVKKDFQTLRAGVGIGLGEFMASALNQVAENGFVRVYAGDTLPLAKGKVNGLYPEAPGLNVKSADRVVQFPAGKKNKRSRTVTFPGRRVFAFGKVVSRRGRLPADLQGLMLRHSSSGESGVVAQFGNGRSVINIERRGSVFSASFLPNPKNMLAWLGFEYGRGVAGNMTIVLDDGSASTVKGKVGQRRIIQKGLVQAMKLWNKAAQGRLESYMKRKSRNAK